MPFPTTHLDKESTTKCDFLSTTLMMKTCPFPLPILTKNQLPSVRVSGHIPMCHFFAQIVQYQPYFPASKVLGVRVLLYRQSTIIHKLKGPLKKFKISPSALHVREGWALCSEPRFKPKVQGIQTCLKLCN